MVLLSLLFSLILFLVRCGSSRVQCANGRQLGKNISQVKIKVANIQQNSSQILAPKNTNQQKCVKAANQYVSITIRVSATILSKKNTAHKPTTEPPKKQHKSPPSTTSS